MVEWDPFLEVILTSSTNDGDVRGLENTVNLHASNEVELRTQVKDWNSNVFLLDKLCNSLIKVVSFLWFEYNWSGAAKESVTLSFNFFSIEFFLSSESLLFLSNDFLVFFNLSSEAFEISFTVFDDSISGDFIMSLQFNQSLL